MPASLELVLDLLQLGPQPFRDGVAFEPETSVLAFPAAGREAQEVECLRLAEAPCRSSLDGEPPELDQPGLVGMQFQPELRESLTEVVEELLGVTQVLESDDEIVGEAHDDQIAAGMPTPPLPDPSVEHVVEVDVGEQRRSRRSLRCSLRRVRPLPALDDSCAQPLLDETQDPLVRYPMLEELLQPSPIKLGEEVADIRVEYPVHLLPVDPSRQRIQRIMRAAPWPKPVGEAEEVLLVDGVQHLDDRPLEDLVLQAGDTERPQPPVRLRDVRPP